MDAFLGVIFDQNALLLTIIFRIEHLCLAKIEKISVLGEIIYLPNMFCSWSWLDLLIEREEGERKGRKLKLVPSVKALLLWWPKYFVAEKAVFEGHVGL